jgi:hypothetical protein
MTFAITFLILSLVACGEKKTIDRVDNSVPATKEQGQEQEQDDGYNDSSSSLDQEGVTPIGTPKTKAKQPDEKPAAGNRISDDDEIVSDINDEPETGQIPGATIPGASDNNGSQQPTTPLPPAQELNAQGEVVFRIAAGTGTGSWNTIENPIILKANQTLRVFNDDNASHTVHTNSQNGGMPVHGCTNQFNTRNIGAQGVACNFTNVNEGMISEAQLHDHFTWQENQQGTGRGAVYIMVIQ